MKSLYTTSPFTLAAALAGLFALPASASLVANGGFESGFASWTLADQLGSEGTFAVQSGTSSPLNGFAVPAPPQGSQAAMTDSYGPGSHVLYQDFVVPAAVPAANLAFSLFVNNGAEAFTTPNHLEFATPDLNQQARVDLVKVGADPFSIAAGDVLMNLYQTGVGDDLVSGYTAYSLDVTALFQAHAGETLRLRFAEVDNVNFFNFGVDDVSVTVGGQVVPEASTWIAMPAVLGLLAFGYRRRAAGGSRG